ncbi:MAG: 4Fe-4S dicluster domain-containing protein [Pelovirga sp.]
MANNKLWTIVFDADKCIDCKACDVACKRENGLDAKGNQDVRRNWINTTGVGGTYPNLKQSFQPEQCHQCGNPPCVPVCPVNATWAKADGVVVIDKDICIGCTLCVIECPYEARYMTENDTADKCDFCAHRVAEGKEPACVDTCPTKVRVFGDMNDPNSAVAKLLKANPNAKVLHPERGTKPNLHYIS